MSRILSDEDPDAPVVRFGSRTVVVNGTPYDNSAAKFWTALIDEVELDYAGCNSMSLTAMGSEPLAEDILYPVNTLQREMDKGLDISIEEAIRLAVEESSMFGPPSGVLVTLFKGNSELMQRRLPGDCADAGAFVYLYAWLLYWAGVDAERWNNDLLSGSIKARDMERQFVYKMNIAFRNEHVSEGLFRRMVTLKFSRDGLKPDVKPAKL